MWLPCCWVSQICLPPLTTLVWSIIKELDCVLMYMILPQNLCELTASLLVPVPYNHWVLVVNNHQCTLFSNQPPIMNAGHPDQEIGSILLAKLEHGNPPVSTQLLEAYWSVSSNADHTKFELQTTSSWPFSFDKVLLLLLGYTHQNAVHPISQVQYLTSKDWIC